MNLLLECGELTFEFAHTSFYSDRVLIAPLLCYNSGAGCQLVFVFDGAREPSKAATLSQRRQAKQDLFQRMMHNLVRPFLYFL